MQGSAYRGLLPTEGKPLPPHHEQTDAYGKTLTSLAVDKAKIHTHFFLVTDELNRNGSSIHQKNGINFLHDDSQTLARVSGLKSALPK